MLKNSTNSYSRRYKTNPAAQVRNSFRNHFNQVSSYKALGLKSTLRPAQLHKFGSRSGAAALIGSSSGGFRASSLQRQPQMASFTKLGESGMRGVGRMETMKPAQKDQQRLLSIKPGTRNDSFLRNRTSGLGRLGNRKDTGGNRVNTLRRTLQSGVSKASEQFSCIVENRSREIGIASFSLFTGAVFITKFNDNCMYDYTCSFLNKLNPQLVITQESNFSNFLKKRILDTLPSVTVKQENSFHFNEVRGREIYQKISTANNTSIHSTELNYTSMAALCALYETFMVANNIQDFSKLTIQNLQMDQFVLVDITTINNLEILQNKRTKNNSKICLIDKFKCMTFGGERLLRSNLLQPIKRGDQISARQGLVAAFLDDYEGVLEIQSWLKNFKNFDNLAVKVLCFDDDYAGDEKNGGRVGFNVEFFGKLVFDVVNFLQPLETIREEIRKVYLKQKSLIATQSHPAGQGFQLHTLKTVCSNLEELITNLDTSFFKDFKTYVSANFDLSLIQSNHTPINTTHSHHTRNPKPHQRRKKKAKNTIYWVKEKMSVVIDLSRISYARIEERVDEVLQYYKSRLIGEKVTLKVETNKNGIFLKMRKNGLKKQELDVLKKDYFEGDEGGLFCWSEYRAYVLVQTEELKKLSISREGCYNELINQTGFVIKEAIFRLKAYTDRLFKINFALSRLDMVLAVARFSSLQRKSTFPKFAKNQQNSGTLLLKQALDPLCVGDGSSSEAKSVDYFMSDLSSVHFLIGEQGVGKTTYALGLLRLVLVAYLGARIPAELASIPNLDFLSCCLSQAQIKDKFRSSFESELKRVERVLELVFKTKKSLVVVDNYGASTTFNDSLVQNKVLIELLYKHGAYAMVTSNDFQLSCIIKTHPFLNLLKMRLEGGKREVESFTTLDFQDLCEKSLNRIVEGVTEARLRAKIFSNFKKVCDEWLAGGDQGAGGEGIEGAGGDDDLNLYAQNLFEMLKDFSVLEVTETRMKAVGDGEAERVLGGEDQFVLFHLEEKFKDKYLSGFEDELGDEDEGIEDLGFSLKSSRGEVGSLMGSKKHFFGSSDDANFVDSREGRRRE